MKELIINYWMEFALTIVSGALILIVKNLYKKMSALMQGTQALLRAELIRSGEKYVDRQYVEIYAKDAFDKAYWAYHGLGKNGTMDELHEQVMNLPTHHHKEKEE